MAELNTIDFKELKLPNGDTVSIPVLVTLSDSYLENKTDKKISRDWKIFKAKMGKDKPKSGYFSASDFELSEDDVFKDKEQVYAINMASVSAIDVKELEKLDFGFRIYMSDGSLKQLGKKQIDDMGTTLNSGLEFDQIQDLHERLYNQLNNTASEFEFKENAKERNQKEIERSTEKTSNEFDESEEEILNDSERNDKQKDKQSEDKSQSNDTEDDKLIDTPSDKTEEESEQLKNDEEHKSENIKQDIEETPNTEEIQQVDNVQEEIEESDVYYDDDDVLNSMKMDARQYINSYIPVDSIEVTLKTPTLKNENKEFKDLYNTTIEGINSKINAYNGNIKSERTRAINHLSRELEKEIAKRYYDNQKILDYKDEANEYNEIYNKLEQGLQDVLDDLEPASKEHKQRLLREHKQKKEEVKHEASERAGREFDQEELPKIDESVEQEKETRKQRAYEIYNNEMDQLDEDVEVHVSENNNRLVDGVLEDFKPIIESTIHQLDEKYSLYTKEIQNEMNEKWNQFEDRIKEIQATRIKSENEKQATIDAEVKKLVPQIDEYKQEIKQHENEIETLRSSLRDLRDENHTKESSIKAFSDERSKMIERVDRAEDKADKAEEKANKLEKEKTALYKEYNDFIKGQNAVDGHASSFVTPSESKEDKHQPWYEKFKAYIIAGGTSIILGTSIIWGAHSVTTDNDNQKAQQTELEQAQKENKNTEKQQKKQASELKQTKQDLEKQQQDLDDREKKIDQKEKDKKDKK